VTRLCSRLAGVAALTTLTFVIFDFIFAYAVIDVFRLHAPLPGRSELAMLAISLAYTAPLIFGLTLLGLAMAWSQVLLLPIRVMLVQTVLGGLLFAALFTLEELPRHGALWLVLLLPLAVVFTAFASTRFLAGKARAPMSDALARGYKA
jgi:hypothetical protein